MENHNHVNFFFYIEIMIIQRIISEFANMMHLFSFYILPKYSLQKNTLLQRTLKFPLKKIKKIENVQIKYNVQICSLWFCDFYKISHNKKKNVLLV